MIKCWGYIYGDKIEDGIKKWLENKYAIRKLEITQDN